MASQANLALKNAAGGAVVGTALSSSAGNGVPAKWRIETATPPAFRPTLELTASDSAKTKKVRRVNLRANVPFTFTDSNGVVQSTLSIPMIADVYFPQEIPTSVSDDAVAYFASFWNDPGVIAALKAQIAPT